MLEMPTLKQNEGVVKVSTRCKINLASRTGVRVPSTPPITWDDLKFPPINLHNIGEKK